MKTKLKKTYLLIPMNEEDQKTWFKFAGIKMPKDQWLRRVALFGIAHLSVNCKWNEAMTIKDWWLSFGKKNVKK